MRRGSDNGRVEAPPRNPFVFVVGCPRSGTTLLQRMLDHHPQLAVANDSNFIPKAVKAGLPDGPTWIKQGMNPPLTPELAEYVRTYKRFRRLELPDADVRAAAAASQTFAQFVSRIYELYAAKHGKRFAGEKTPDYVRRMPFLHRLFPSTPFVHIVRDARDVALSARDWADAAKGPGKFELWRDEPMATCALWWCWMVATGRRDGQALGPGLYHEVRYEQLVAEPEPVLRRLVAFLGLPFDRAMLRYHENKSAYQPGTSAKSAWLPPTQGLRDWRAQLPPRELQMIETLAGDLLTELEYPHSGAKVEQEVAAAAAQCRRWWVASAKG